MPSKFSPYIIPHTKCRGVSSVTCFIQFCGVTTNPQQAFKYIWPLYFYPSAIKAVGYSDHQSRAGGRAVRNSAITKKLTDEFCLFFTGMTYVPGQLIPYIFFGTKP